VRAAPTLALGTAQWGRAYGISNRSGPPSREQLTRMLKAAESNGVATLDTARAYGSEEVIGELLGGDKRWRIVTKLAPDLLDGNPPEPEVRRRTEASLAASLSALRVERLEALLVHRARHRDHPPLWDVLRGWKDSGRISAIGVSAESPSLALQYLEDPEVDVLQVASSLFDQRLSREGFFERARGLGKEVFVRSVFLQGAPFLPEAELADRLPGLLEPVREVRRHLLGSTRSLQEILLVYARDHFRASLVIGAETPEQLGEILSAWRSSPLEGPLEELTQRGWDLPDEVLDPSRWLRR